MAPGVAVFVLEARHRASLWIGPRVDAELSWRVPGTQLSLSALLGAMAPIERDVFVLDDIGTVHRPSSLVGRTSLGIDLLF